LLEHRVKVKILKSLKEMRGIKFNTGLDVVFSKQDKDGRLIIQVFYIVSKARTITNESEIEGALSAHNHELLSKIDRYKTGGSGWTVDEIQRHYITISTHAPLAAKTYVPLPPCIQSRKATINIKNDDNKCFTYCLGRALDPNPETQHLERVTIHLLNA